MSPARIDDFPRRLEGPLCWTAHSVKPYIQYLTPTDVASICWAVARFQELALPVACVSPQTFPIRPSLAERLRAISDEVHDGQGFVVLRGLNPSAFSNDENTLIFCGLSSYVGLQRSTNALGDALNHIRDARKDKVVLENKREDVCLSAAKLPEAMKFHADGRYGDIIAMYVKDTGRSGGTQYVASFWSVFNRLRASSPQTLETLAEDVLFPEEMSPAYCHEENRRPFIYTERGKVLCQMTWNPFRKSKSMSEAQREAMLKVNDVSKDVCIELDHQAGDIQFLNNFAILHARDSYKNAQGSSRHMMRMGLRDPRNQWETPKTWSEFFDDHYWCPPELQSISSTDTKPWHHGRFSSAPDHG